VTNDVDTLATALYVKTDDLLRQFPDLAPWRPQSGLQPRLSDAELVTLAVMQALLGYASEARWVRHAHAHLGHLFRYLPGQPGYNRRLRAAAGLITTMTRMLAADTSLWTDDVWVADSTPVECGRSRETARRSDLAGWAEYGYCASLRATSGDCACTCCAPLSRRPTAAFDGLAVDHDPAAGAHPPMSSDRPCGHRRRRERGDRSPDAGQPGDLIGREGQSQVPIRAPSAMASAGTRARVSSGCTTRRAMACRARRA
jgi:hypothetical protein